MVRHQQPNATAGEGKRYGVMTQYVRCAGSAEAVSRREVPLKAEIKCVRACTHGARQPRRIVRPCVARVQNASASARATRLR